MWHQNLHQPAPCGPCKGVLIPNDLGSGPRNVSGYTMIYLERNAKQQNCGAPLAPSMLVMIFGHHHHPILSASKCLSKGQINSECHDIQTWLAGKSLCHGELTAFQRPKPRLRFLPHSFLPRNGHFRNLKSHGKKTHKAKI